MELEEALHEWTANQAGIASLISDADRLRFFKLKVEQGAKFPAMVQQRAGADRQYRSCRIDGAVAVSMQIDHYARTWQQMAQLARAFLTALDPQVVSYPFLMGPDDSPPTGVRLKAAILENEFDLDDPEPGLLRRTQSWTFWIVEP